MRPLSTTRLILLRRLFVTFRPANVRRQGRLRISAMTGFLVLLCLFSGAQAAWTQRDSFSGPTSLDPLGAHGRSGRECLTCHPPHNELVALHATATPLMGANVPWGEAANPDYGKSLAIGDTGIAVEVKPSGFRTADAEVTGVLLCLSCHDGNITPQNMMASRSYLQKMGLQPYFHGQAIPSVLEPTRRSSSIDHPLGIEAKIETGSGLEFSNGSFTVRPDTPYARFVASYGLPSLAPRMRSSRYGIDAESRPYLLCTTCHNQHVPNVYVSQPGNPIGGSETVKVYSTFFFVNAPYNPNLHMPGSQHADSATQFCRQCHFDKSNEANNSYFIPTQFQ